MGTEVASDAPVGEALLVAARMGLPVPRRGVRLAPDDGTRLLTSALVDRLEGFVAAAVRAGSIEVDDVIAGDVRAAWTAALVASVRLEAVVVAAAGVLDAENVRWRLTKGSALAHLDYVDPADRVFGDADVVVHPDDWYPAVEALIGAGLHRPVPEIAPGFDGDFGKGATLVDLGLLGTGLEVDLHRRFSVGRFGVLARMGDLFERSDELLLGGVRVPVLDRTGRLLHAGFHASLGGFRRLRAFRDVAQLVLVADADWEEAATVARAWKCEVVLAAAIDETWRRLELEVEHPAVEWARSVDPSRAELRALRVFGEERPFREQALTALGVLPVHSVPRYVTVLSMRPGGRSGKRWASLARRMGRSVQHR